MKAIKLKVLLRLNFWYWKGENSPDPITGSWDNRGKWEQLNRQEPLSANQLFYSTFIGPIEPYLPAIKVEGKVTYGAQIQLKGNASIRNVNAKTGVDVNLASLEFASFSASSNAGLNSYILNRNELRLSQGANINALGIGPGFERSIVGTPGSWENSSTSYFNYTIDQYTFTGNLSPKPDFSLGVSGAFLIGGELKISLKW